MPAQARGDILVEVDHDDELTPDALEVLAKEFGGDPQLHFAYSNCCEIRAGKPWKYSEQYGWETRPFVWQGDEHFEMLRVRSFARLLQQNLVRSQSRPRLAG